MKSEFTTTPRTFQLPQSDISIKDYGKLLLDPDEMISLKSPSGRECDITAKSWGYYLGPSLNGRFKKEGYKSALVANQQGKIYLYAIEVDKMADFNNYLSSQSGSRVLCWLDDWQEGMPPIQSPGNPPS